MNQVSGDIRNCRRVCNKIMPQSLDVFLSAPLGELGRLSPFSVLFMFGLHFPFTSPVKFKTFFLQYEFLFVAKEEKYTKVWLKTLFMEHKLSEGFTALLQVTQIHVEKMETAWKSNDSLPLWQKLFNDDMLQLLKLRTDVILEIWLWRVHIYPV